MGDKERQLEGETMSEGAKEGGGGGAEWTRMGRAGPACFKFDQPAVTVAVPAPALSGNRPARIYCVRRAREPLALEERAGQTGRVLHRAAANLKGRSESVGLLGPGPAVPDRPGSHLKCKPVRRAAATMSL